MFGWASEVFGVGRGLKRDSEVVRGGTGRCLRADEVFEG